MEKEGKRRRGETHQSIRRLRFRNEEREEGYEEKFSITLGHTTEFQKLERKEENFKILRAYDIKKKFKNLEGKNEKDLRVQSINSPHMRRPENTHTFNDFTTHVAVDKPIGV